MKPYCQGHLDFLVDIDIKSYDEPWEPQQLHKCGPKIRVCTLNDEVVGFYLIDQQVKLGRMVKFAVRPSVRRQGIGTFMMDSLLLNSWDLDTLSILVDEFNLGSQLFLKATYFGCKRQLKGKDGANYLFVRPTCSQRGEF